MATTVLVVDDEPILTRNIKTYLERHQYAVTTAQSGEEGLCQLDSEQPAVILLDYRLQGMNGLEFLERLRSRGSSTKVIMMTGNGSIDVAVRSIKSGAFDYLSKPVVLSELKRLIEKAVDHELYNWNREVPLALTAGAPTLCHLIGESAPMLQLKESIRCLIEAERTLTDNNAPAVLITGETGTGKELVARALHFEGLRGKLPFIEINCAALPSHLLEAELFGYERGAFTDARERKSGLVEEAEGGTLFLDEIGEIEMSVQSKLVKILEEKRVRRVGGLREHAVNFRIIAATNQDLEKLIQEGRFRSDLFYRLRMMHLELPPLRERGDDIILLANAFLKLHAARYRKGGLYFAQATLEKLRHAPWVGNVRELRNTLEQTILMAQKDAIEAHQVILPRLTPQESDTTFAALGPIAEGSTEFNLERMERDYLMRALSEAGWNVTRASRLLGLSRDTLRYRMEKYQIRKGG